MFFLSLGMILVIGGIFGFLANKIRIPSLIVYLLLGLIMGYFGLIIKYKQ
jgi:Kef-type K+ transport system membrane component KefB